MTRILLQAAAVVVAVGACVLILLASVRGSWVLVAANVVSLCALVSCFVSLRRLS